jgi:hypothetical protein
MSWSEAANSVWFWALLIGGLGTLYFPPVIVALIRQAEHLGIIVMLNMFPLLWPGALAGAFILPRRQPPPRSTPTRRTTPARCSTRRLPPVLLTAGQARQSITSEDEPARPSPQPRA